MLIILLNCVTLGMYQPCVDDKCQSNRCKILQIFDDFIFAFFSLEMSVKMIAMGVYGKGTYLADSWNRLDFFIVVAGALEYCMHVENMNLSAIRTIRVLRPLRAINRIPSMRILVMLLLDTLPMLGNVLLLCFFVFFIFGIVGVQLWEGILRQRCFLNKDINVSYPKPLATYYKYVEQDRDYICSKPDASGMHTCADLPPYKVGDLECNRTYSAEGGNEPNEHSCVNWNQYYTKCMASPFNPFQGTISFDNIGLAWVAIFLVISLEGWTDIMYYVQDAHSFWDWIYFVLLIVIGSFFMINLCLVVIATQFAETKKREMERMRLERERFRSTSTLASSTNNSEPTSCYAEIVKYVAHLWRRGKRRLFKKYHLWKIRRQQQREQKRHLQLIAGGGSGVPTAGAIILQQYRGGGGNGGGNGARCHMYHHHHHHHHHPHHHHRGCHGITTSDLTSGRGRETSLAPTLMAVEDDIGCSAPRASPEVSDVDPLASPRRPGGGLLRVSSTNNGWGDAGSAAEGLLSPPLDGHRRKSSVVMFSEVVLLHGESTTTGESARNVCSSEKMTQTGDGNVWPVLGFGTGPHQQGLQSQIEGGNTVMGAETMTCQELLALSGALSAALPTGQLGLGSFFSSLSKGPEPLLSEPHPHVRRWSSPDHHSEMCCGEHPWSGGDWSVMLEGGSGGGGKRRRRCSRVPWRWLVACCTSCLRSARRSIKTLVDHKYFQLGILLAILINTLSMGIEYHNQPEWLTVTVEISNVVFSAVFAVEMVLKIIAEGPFGYVSNGFNVFDGVIVVLSVIEMCQTYLGDGDGSSGLSVLRTFRLLRILKLVRFMPNLRRQLFVMLRTMDNVAVFFSLLILFIFIFSILGMNLFGCKFCDKSHEGSDDSDVSCDRKNFDTLLWAIVTVFQILTQEDWNVVLFNGMHKTSHWAALYFVALMTFGNYVLFNLLVAILVEGFSAERNERREREQRELAKQHSKCDYSDNMSSLDGSRTSSSSDTDSCHIRHQEHKNKWRSAEELRKTNNGHREKENIWKQKHHLKEDYEPKCNIQKESMLSSQTPIITHTAATPQDSPNTTLDPGMRDFNNKLSPAIALYSSSLSIDSIDRSTSSQSSIPGLLKPPNNKFNNLSPNSSGRRVSLVTVVNQSAIRRDPAPSTPRIQRVCSWKISRPSLRRKSRGRSGSEPEDSDQVLNNGLNNNVLHCGDHSHCNGGLLGTIRNDTQGPPNNNNLRGIYQTRLSPQNSIRGQDAQGYWAGGTNNSQHKPLTPQNSISSYHGSLLNGGSVRSSSVQYDDSAKPINNLAARDVTETSPLPQVKQIHDDPDSTPLQGPCLASTVVNLASPTPVQGEIPCPPPGTIKKIFMFFEPRGCLKEREDYSLYVFPSNNGFRQMCWWFVEQKWFDNLVLLFIGLNCITLAMERPNIPPESTERVFLASANYVFTGVFAIEMFVKVVAAGMFYGREAYFTSGWNIMDGSLVIISIIDLLMSLLSHSSPRIFGILRVFRLLRSLRPLRVINRAPGLKLVVQTLLSSLRPIGNIVLICCTFFIIFGILGVQLFKGAFFYCEGPNIKHVRNRTECEADKRNSWNNRKYNFDDLGKALMSLFVLSSRDGWVNIMYTGLDAVGVDQQPIENYSEWRLLYFIAFILLVGFFVLNMFVGVVVENFHRCREEQEKEERVRRMAKRARQMEKKRRKMHEPPYYTSYSHSRLMVHNVVTSKYFDLAIAGVILLNVITMAMEFYLMPKALSYILKIFNYFFTAVFILESVMKLVSLGFKLYFKDRWNQLDVMIVILSIVGIVLEELESKIIPVNPTIIRVMRVLRIARVLKLLKMAKGIRALLDTVMQALPQVGNLGLLFFLLFFIFAALGVELFGRLLCDDEHPCQGLGEHADFSNFGMAFLTLFRVATGDNWNGIMKDTLRDDCDETVDCVKNCCVSTVIAPIFFVIFVLMAQFVLVNVVVAVLMKHLEESHKQMEDEMDMDVELERELAAEQEELLMEEEEEIGLQQALEMSMDMDKYQNKKPLAKVLSLPSNFTFSSPSDRKNSIADGDSSVSMADNKRRGSNNSESRRRSHRKNQRRRQTFHSHQGLMLLPPGIPPAYPATEYTAVYKTATAEEVDGEEEAEEAQDDARPWVLPAKEEPEAKLPLKRLGSDPPPDSGAVGGLLAVPNLKQRDMGSTKHLNLTDLIVASRHSLWPESQPTRREEDSTPTSLVTSEDVSPECVSPAAILVPPPYGAATRTASLQTASSKSTETPTFSDDDDEEEEERREMILRVPTEEEESMEGSSEELQLLVPERTCVSSCTQSVELESPPQTVRRRRSGSWRGPQEVPERQASQEGSGAESSAPDGARDVCDDSCSDSLVNVPRGEDSSLNCDQEVKGQNEYLLRYLSE